MASGPSPNEILGLDPYTLKDLEIFSSDDGAMSLFDLCNSCGTEGGAKVLRRRMEQPWSSTDRIRTTQQSLTFIIEHRDAFAKLGALAFTANRVDHYAHEILPVVTAENAFEFTIEALTVWANHERHYLGIVRGVQFASRMVRILREFISQDELAEPAGELTGLLAEVRLLLTGTRFNQVPVGDVGSWALRILRLDQVFRLLEKDALNRLLQLIHELDALVSMADATSKYAFVMPTIGEGPMAACAEGVVHPLVPDAVANPVNLNQKRRVLFLTGPNMAGKTTYLRAFATALYLAHLGMGVPARSFRFVPAQRLFSSISLSDDLRGGVSYFRAEALRVRAIAEAVAQGYRVVAVMDEPFKGTNVKDALDASLAIMERLAVRQDCLFMFSSHLIELSEKLAKADQVDCRYFDAKEDGERLGFDYQLRQGVSDQRLGMRVLREEGIFELLDR